VNDRNQDLLQLRKDEQALLMELRALRRKRRSQGTSEIDLPLTAGQRIADAVATTMGSWRFIIIQSTILLLWIALNVTAYVQRWDPYPFILLNLALSFQAAYAAPFIMMSQNRQQDVDRTKRPQITRSTSRPSWRLSSCTRRLMSFEPRKFLHSRSLSNC